jgi:branched-chain amino acid transport system substrate-binding protein
VDSQVINLRASGADVVVLAAVPKFAAQAIRKMIELEWQPTVYVSLGASGVAATTEPAKGKSDLNLYSGAFFKDWNNAHWRDDPTLRDFLHFMSKYAPDMKADDFASVYGYSVAQTLVHVLQQCGDDLSRENIMKQASSIKDLELPLLIPSIKINTGPNDHYPIEQIQLTKWDGQKWEPQGAIIDSSR